MEQIFKNKINLLTIYIRILEIHTDEPLPRSKPVPLAPGQPDPLISNTDLWLDHQLKVKE